MSSAAPGEHIGHAGGPTPRRREPRPGVPLPRAASGLSWAAFTAVAVLATILVGLHINSYRQLSIFDEPQHIDYVYRVLDGGFPSSGDVWLPATVAAATCRTIDYPTPLPRCTDDAELLELPNNGLSMASIHTPAYYGVAAGAVLLDRAFGGWVDDVDAMRSTGALWLVVALWLLWLLWRDFDVPWQTRTGFSLALIATPIVLLSHSAVTNDATALASGAALLLATLRWDRGSARLWLPLAVAFVALLLKATNLALVLAVCVFVLVRALQQSTAVRGRWRAVLARRNLAFVGALGAVTVLVGAGWSIVVSARATIDPSDDPQHAMMAVDQFDPSWLLSSVLALSSPLQPQFLQSALDGSAAAVIAALADIGLLALAIVGAARSEPGSTVRALAIATAVAALAFGPFLTIVNFVTAGVQFEIPARYGLSLVPALAVVAGTAVRTPRGGTVLLVVGATLYALISGALLV